MSARRPQPLTDDLEMREGDGLPPGRPPTRRQGERAAAEFALLGLIAQTEQREIHGYDLVRAFSDGVLGRIVRLEPGMLYHYLKKLARDGYITTRHERQTGRPDRQVHALTPEGEQALLGWITAPVHSTREIRLDFLVKLYLARQIVPEAAADLVGKQRAALGQRAHQLETQLADPQPEGADNAFGESVLQLRLTQTQAALAWLGTLAESR